jgi:8-oxo-dGTP diphosphatase
MTSSAVMHGHGRFRYCPNCSNEMTPTEVEGKTLQGCSSCGYIHYLDPKIAAGVIASNENGEVLLMQRNHEPRKGLWSYPSGYVDSGEKVEDAAVRETLEETQVRVKLDGLLGVYSETGNRVVLVVYRGSIVDGEPTAGPESLAVGFFDPNELPELAFPRDGQIIEEWRSG